MNICVCLAGLSQIGGMLLIPGEKDISCRYCQAIPLSWVSTDHIDNIVAIFFTIILKQDHFPIAFSTAKCLLKILVQNSYGRNFRVNVFTLGLHKLQSRLAKKMIQFNIQFKSLSGKVILNVIHSKHCKNCKSWQLPNTSVLESQL